MKKPIKYNISPAKGQALLNFEGRRYPDSVELFDTQIIEEVKPVKEAKLFKKDKQSELNPDFKNLLIHGDCLSACAYLKSENIKVDLVYIDPPFASGANYAKKIYLRNGGKTNLENDAASIGEEIMYGDIWQKEDYLNWLYERLLAIKDILSETGSIYVHLDWHIGHYVKLLLDEIFGENSFQNEIIWCYREAINSKERFNRKHDNIYFYTKSDSFYFNADDVLEPHSEGTVKKYKNKDEKGRYRLMGRGIVDSPVSSQRDINPEWEKTHPELVYRHYLRTGSYAVDYWNIDIINQASSERLNYSTQKPEKLLEKIIKASSNNGMIVVDFFSGSGVAAKVANDLNRKFIACDIGINAIQTSRDRLINVGAEFDILKINDGVRLFRNPAQTTAKIFSLIDGFKNKTELELGSFWDGGIINKKGNYTPIKFIGIHEKLTKELVDVILEEVYQIEGDDAEGVRIIYAHKDFEVDQKYINKEIKRSGKTELKVELISLDDILGHKADVLFTPDDAEIIVNKDGSIFKVEIKKYFSSYLKNKIDDFNAKKVKKTNQAKIDENEEEETSKQKKEKFVPIKISEKGLELIESVQFDTTLRQDGVWISNPELEDKAEVKEKIQGKYLLPTNKFKIKIRNIAGDELLIDSKDI